MSAAFTTKTVQYDWARFDAMSDEQRKAAAQADPDATPLGPEDAGRMRRTPRVKIIRRAMGWSREQFSRAFHIPVSMLEDWESGRNEPDEPTRAYLDLIASCPDVVAEVLNATQAEKEPFPTGPGSEYLNLRRYGDRASRRA